jgi:hypothetical protein
VDSFTALRIGVGHGIVESCLLRQSSPRILPSHIKYQEHERCEFIS